MIPAETPPPAARVLRFLCGVALVIAVLLAMLPAVLIGVDYCETERARKDHEAIMAKADRENARLLRKLEKTLGRPL